MMCCLNRERSMAVMESEREKEIRKNAVSVVILVLPHIAMVPAPVWNNSVLCADGPSSTPTITFLPFPTFHPLFFQFPPLPYPFRSYIVLSSLNSLRTSISSKVEFFLGYYAA
jgi:hypothetical protein